MWNFIKDFLIMFRARKNSMAKWNWKAASNGKMFYRLERLPKSMVVALPTYCPIACLEGFWRESRCTIRVWNRTPPECMSKALLQCNGCHRWTKLATFCTILRTAITIELLLLLNLWMKIVSSSSPSWSSSCSFSLVMSRNSVWTFLQIFILGGCILLRV
jgi:hypothetical protein